MNMRNDNRGMLFNMLIGAGLALVILFAVLNIGSYINGTISTALVESYGEATERTELENATVEQLENITAGFGQTIDVVVVAAIIMAITMPLAAVVAIKKLL